jgi:hypothetical protein
MLVCTFKICKHFFAIKHCVLICIWTSTTIKYLITHPIPINAHELKHANTIIRAKRTLYGKKCVLRIF